MPLSLAANIHTPWSDPWIWAGFVLFVVAAMLIDLGLHRRSSGALSTRAALVWSGIWIALALVFNVIIFLTLGVEKGEEFLAGYLLEKSLSVDNLFVFVLVFAFFRTPPREQRRVLVWGIIGAMVLRAIMILAGAALIHTFHYTLAFFGAFLVYTGIKLLFHDDDADPGDSRIVRVLRRILPLTEGPAPGDASESQRLVEGGAHGYRGSHFMVVEGGKRRFTTLFLVLLVIEFSDVVFAVDSVPAIFGITSDPFIVFTSNIFALLGLRALFFVIAAAIQRLRYLNYGLSIVLSFIGIKMLLPFGAEAYHAATEKVPNVPFLKTEDRTEYDLDVSVDAGGATRLLRVPAEAFGPRGLTLTADPADGAEEPVTVRVFGFRETPPHPGEPAPAEGAVLLGEGQLELPAERSGLPLGRTGDGERFATFFVRLEGGGAVVEELELTYRVSLHFSSLQSLLIICVVLTSTTVLSLARGAPPEGGPADAAASEASETPSGGEESAP